MVSNAEQTEWRRDWHVCLCFVNCQAPRCNSARCHVWDGHSYALGCGSVCDHMKEARFQALHLNTVAPDSSAPVLGELLHQFLLPAGCQLLPSTAL